MTEQIPIPVLTPSQAKELGARPVGEEPRLTDTSVFARAFNMSHDLRAFVEGRIATFGYGDKETAALDAQAIDRLLSMARQSLGGGSEDSVERVMVVLDRWFDGALAINRDSDMVKELAALSSPAVTSPVAWAKPEGLEYIKNGPKGCVDFITAETTKNYTTPLFTRPNPVSAELVEAGKAVEAAITAFANMALLAVPADHNPTVRAVLGEGLYNAHTRLRAALSAHAGGTV